MPAPASFTLLSIVPALEGGKGHVLGYQQAVGRAATLNGWHHVLATPPGHGLPQLPPGWHASLAATALDAGLPALIKRGRIWALLKGIGSFADSVAAAVRRELRESPGDCAIFVESFNGPQLLAICLAAMRLDRARLHFWILFRQEPAAMGFGWPLYVGVAKWLARLSGPGRFRLLTDSEPLRATLSVAFGRPAHVMPIPHTEVSEGATFAKREGEVLCWWPGSSRPEKGLDVVRDLAKRGATDRQDGRTTLRMVVSRASGLQPQEGLVSVDLVDDVLSPQDYQQWLRTADAILLPYSSQRYRASTSGIFAECIAAGKIPLVSRGTWMAFELEKYGVDELVCDWAAPDIVTRIIAAAQGEPLKRKIAAMQSAFLGFHCEESYAHELQALIPQESGD
ncbi:MAG: hypothetical protein JWQ07_601 [Ramlibacter sp.]|nr:hypothetical protein [Ramlibacter sp.]